MPSNKRRASRARLASSIVFAFALLCPAVVEPPATRRSTLNIQNSGDRVAQHSCRLAACPMWPDARCRHHRTDHAGLLSRAIGLMFPHARTGLPSVLWLLLGLRQHHHHGSPDVVHHAAHRSAGLFFTGYWHSNAGPCTLSPPQCPVNSTLIGSACTCKAGYQPNASATACVSAVVEEASCPVGNPVLPGTGRKLHEETDYAGAGAAPLDVRRYYRSVWSDGAPAPGLAPIAAGGGLWKLSVHAKSHACADGHRSRSSAPTARQWRSPHRPPRPSPGPRKAAATRSPSCWTPTANAAAGATRYSPTTASRATTPPASCRASRHATAGSPRSTTTALASSPACAMPSAAEISFSYDASGPRDRAVASRDGRG